MAGEFQGKVAVITGGSRGIGRAIAAAFAKEGAKTVLISSSEGNLASAAKTVAAAGGPAPVTIVANLKTLDGCQQAFNAVKDKVGRCDILVNSAGATRAGNFVDLPDEAWMDGYALKMFACVRMCRLLWPMLKDAQGHVVNISGGAAWTPQLGAIATGMNNAAVQNLTIALANDLAKDGILVNAVVPTAVRTERHDQNIKDTMAKTGQSEAEVLKPRVAKIPLGRMGTSEEIANVVVFMCSERASFVAGSLWAVDGGVSARL